MGKTKEEGMSQLRGGMCDNEPICSGFAAPTPGPGKLNIFFIYAKEELTCFRSGEIDDLIKGACPNPGETCGSGEEMFNNADMIVFLQLAHRPDTDDINNSPLGASLSQ